MSNSCSAISGVDYSAAQGRMPLLSVRLDEALRRQRTVVRINGSEVYDSVHPASVQDKKKNVLLEMNVEEGGLILEVDVPKKDLARSRFLQLHRAVNMEIRLAAEGEIGFRIE